MPKCSIYVAASCRRDKKGFQCSLSFSSLCQSCFNPLRNTPAFISWQGIDELRELHTEECFRRFVDDFSLLTVVFVIASIQLFLLPIHPPYYHLPQLILHIIALSVPYRSPANFPVCPEQSVVDVVV